MMLIIKIRNVKMLHIPIQISGVSMNLLCRWIL